MESIDAVEMVRRIRDAHFEETKGKSWEELKEYFHREAKLANSEARELLRKRRSQ